MNIKTLLVAVALVACVGTSYAQGFGGGGGRGQGRMMGGQFGRGGGALQLVMREEVQTELKLTDDQKSKLTELQQAQREAMRGMFQGGGDRPDPEKMREMMEKSQKEQQEKIDAILSAEQKTRLRELTIQRAGNGAIAMPDVAKELGLTDDQKAKLKALQSQMQEANQALMEKVRNQEMDFQEVREKMTNNQKVMDEKIAEILTEEQKTKLKTMRGAEFKFAPDQQRRGGGGRRGNGN